MSFKITKKTIGELVDEYIDDGCKPASQLEPRFGDCFDKHSIRDEIAANISSIDTIKTIEELRRVIRLLLEMAEEHANKYKRVKIIAHDIAFAYQSLQDALSKFIIV